MLGDRELKISRLEDVLKQIALRADRDMNCIQAGRTLEHIRMVAELAAERSDYYLDDRLKMLKWEKRDGEA